MTCLIGDSVACFALHSRQGDICTCSYVGMAGNPLVWGLYRRTLWYEDYGFVKAVFWDTDTGTDTAARIYFDRERYLAKRERLHGVKGGEAET